jgi:hypothetical protein
MKVSAEHNCKGFDALKVGIATAGFRIQGVTSANNAEAAVIG